MNWFNNSRLFDLARQGQRLTHIAAVIPLSFVFMIGSQLGVIPIFLIMKGIYGSTGNSISLKGVSNTVGGMWSALILVSAFTLAYVFLWAWLKWFEKRPFWTLGYEIKNAFIKYGRGFLFGILMFAGAVSILALFGSISFEQGDPTKQGLPALGGVLLVLIGWIVQGGSEEIIMRGWVLPVIGARYKPWIGLFVSSIIFAIMHGLNPGISALALINLALFGVFAGLYAMREGSLWGISAMHTAWNWVQGNFFGLEVSGNSEGGGALINLMAKGADWFTGGAFGPEGGLAVTIVLIVGLLILLFWKGKEAIQEVSVQ